MKRVLSIDGGGVRGVLPASFLASVEDQIGHNPAEYFDLIVGTSTGGIIALALGARLSACEIRDFYLKRGPRIFTGRRLRRPRHIVTSKYSAGRLRDELRGIFGKSLIGDSATRLVIPSMDLTTGKVRLWKTAHHERFVQDHRCFMVDAAIATSSAPTYFRPSIGTTGLSLVDGGLFANNPAAIGAVEAIGVLGWAREEVSILSLGCGTEVLDVRPTWWRRGLLGSVSSVASVFLAAQSDSATGMAIHLLGDRRHFYRVNPILPAKRYGLDVAGSIPELNGIGDSEARHRLQDIRGFFETRAAPFVPAHVI